jgi:hypothetical protein
MHYFLLRSSRLHQGMGNLYSPDCREGLFPKIELPVYNILGNSGHRKSRGC